MDRRDAFEQSWALRHRVSVEEIGEHRFQTEDGYDLPLLATNYRTQCAAVDSVVVELPDYCNCCYEPSEVGENFLEAIKAAGIKVAE